MKRILALILCVMLSPLAAVAADQQPKTPTLDLYWEGLSPDAWRNFFMADAVQLRLPAGAVQIKHHVIVSKGKDGQWSSRKGELELKEAARLAALQQYYPEKMRLYLVARSLGTSFHGWQNAARFAGIDPDRLEQQAKDGKEKFFEKAAADSSAAGVFLPAALVNGVIYTGKPDPVALLEKVNELLPEKTRVAVPVAKPIQSPKMLVVVSETGAGGESMRITKALGRVFGASDANAEKLIYESAEFKKNFGKVKLSSLPAYLFKEDQDTEIILKTATGMPVVKSGGYIVFADSSEGAYYPDNKRKAQTLELFVMSQCPFGVMAEQALYDAMKEKTLPSGVKIKLRFIVNVEQQDGKVVFASLHGDPEWEENARQIFIQAKYPEKLWAYLQARNADYRSPAWEDAAKKAGLDPEAIKNGFEEGKRLLAEDAKVAEEYKVSASPTFLWEGRSVLPGIGALSKIKGFEKIKTGGKPSGSCN
ncbi:MAG TPA: hypothetical protein PLL10_00725 [Elusimicrobiales bacterium]|nr:hypothetical protein [Elusimicrobiales bacterium]